MKTIFSITGTLFLLLTYMNGSAQQKQRLTLEAIFGGNLSESSPFEIRWAPDGRRIAYFLLQDGEERALWILDIDTGRKTQALPPGQAAQMAPSADHASLSERERARRNRYDIPSYSWSPDSRKLLLTSSGQLYIYDLESHAARLASSKSGITDAKFSPDGSRIAYVYQHDLWIAPASGGADRQITFGGGDLLLHGEPDWIYQEELDMHSGYEWSPDSRFIAFLELNESAVPAYPIVEHLGVQAEVELQRYPKAGDPNPQARIGVVDLKTFRTAWVDRTAEYIPRINWADNRACVLQMLSRKQNELELVEVNAETAGSRTLLQERDPYWIDVRNDLRFLSGGREFLWTSDRSGFRHIYHYDRSGNLLRQLTDGEWVVHEIKGIDERNRWIYYISNQASTIGRDLYRVKLDGSGTERLTKEPGTHAVTMNPQATAHIDSFSSMTRMPSIRVTDISSVKEIELFRPRTLEEFDLVSPEMKLLSAPDGATVRLLVYKPQQLESGKHPLLVYAYGMPSVPVIQDAWLGNRGLFHQFMVQQGFVVALIDDRSSAVPGHKNAVAAYRKVGPVAAKDHELAVQYLKSLPYVDGNAMAIWGWSGGGFTAAYHMTHTNLFKAAVAGAPVTDWRLYDSVYTERYMGLPTEAPEDYDRTSTVAAAADYKGRLLLIHGTLDDNVHPQHTYQLMNALIKNKKQFDLMLYPDKVHGITGGAENIHLYTLISTFLQKQLR